MNDKVTYWTLTKINAEINTEEIKMDDGVITSTAIVAGAIAILALLTSYVVCGNWPKMLCSRLFSQPAPLPGTTTGRWSLEPLLWVFKGPCIAVGWTMLYAWKGLRWTTYSMLNAAVVIFWIEVLYVAFVIFWGNPFGKEAWSNIGKEPVAVGAYVMLLVVAILFSVASIRQAIRDQNNHLSDHLKKRALKGAVILFIGIFIGMWLLHGFFPGILSGNMGSTKSPPAVYVNSSTSQNPLLMAEFELTGTTGQPGIDLPDLGPNQKMRIEMISNNLKATGKTSAVAAISLWGFKDAEAASCQKGWWRDVVPYYYLPGAKCGEILILLNGEPIQFSDGKKSRIVENLSTTKSASVSILLNDAKEYWWDSQCRPQYVFPSRSEAQKFGCPNAKNYPGFTPGEYKGAMRFRTTIIN